MLVFIHERIAYVLQAYWLLVAIWALFLAARRHRVSGNLWGALLLGEGVLLLQSLLGGILFVIGIRPANLIHILYGIISISTLPAVYAYTGGDDSPRATTIYGLMALFLFGIILRAIGTAG